MVSPKAPEVYGDLPIAFEANQGQTDPRVKFLSRGSGYTLFLTADEAILAFQKLSAVRHQLSGERNAKLGDGNSKLETRNPSLVTRHSSLDTAVLRMKLVAANSQPAVTGLDALPGRSNYFTGNKPEKWRTRVPNYARVLYQGVYPGIDLVYYGRDRRLEYDFVIAPGADPGTIRLRFENGNSKLETRNWKSETRNLKIEKRKTKFGKGLGQDLVSARQIEPRLHLEADGSLVIETPAGELRFLKPLAYQRQADAGLRAFDAAKPPDATRERVEARYRLKEGKEVAFELGPYDPSRPVIIDPVLSYSTYLGGSASDYAYALAVDAAGSAYVTGYTNSLDFPSGGSAAATLGGGTCGSGLDTYPCYDVFVAKLNPAGTALAYTTYLGGTGDDIGTGVAVDASGSAYVTGYTNSLNLPVLGAAQPAPGGGTCGSGPTTYPCYDAFVAKLDSQGATLLYCTYLGGSSSDFAQGIAVDSAGNALVTGFTFSVDFPTTTGAFQKNFGGSVSDAFVAELDSTGTALLYSTYLGGSGEDYGTKVRVDSAGAAYVTGYTNSSDFPTRSAFQAAPGGGTCGASSSAAPCFDAFVTKLNAQGSALVYSTYLGGSGGDYGYSIAINDAGSAYVTGLTTSTNFPVSAGAVQATGGGNSVDAFVTMLDPTGSVAQYSTYLGGPGTEAGLDVAVDTVGNAYVVGYAYGSGFPVSNPLQAANGGFYDAFLAKLNAAGTALIFSTYLGGSGNEKAHGVAVDRAGNAYLAGGTFSTDFPVTPGALQTMYGSGAFDAFVAKVESLAFPILNLSRATVTFSGQGVGTTSPATTVTLANAGDAPLALAGINVTGDFAQTNDCGAAVAPGTTCLLQITFTPTTLGPRSGNVSISSNAEGRPHEISLVGNGVAAPAVTLSATSLTYADQNINATGPAQTVTLRNTGQAVLVIDRIEVTGSFNQTNTCGSSVPVDGGCAITTTFTPTLPGPAVGAVAITDNAPGNPQMIALVGTGLGPSVVLSSTSLVFGDQLVSTAGPAQTVTLSNTGNRPLEIASLTTFGDFAQTNTCGGSVAAGGSCIISVTFSPSMRGDRTGTITVTDDAAGSPRVIGVTGRGIIAGMCGLSCASLTFGEERVGEASAAQGVRVTNSGDLPLAITGIAASGDYQATHTCGTSLAAGGSCAVSVTFRPTAMGARAGAVTITRDGQESPHVVSLSGTGVAPAVTLSSANLAFGAQGISTISPAQTLTLTNSGTAALNIAGISITGDFAETHTCGASVPSGASCTLAITFRPTTPSETTGMLTLTTDAAGSPQLVSLSGTGAIAFALSAPGNSVSVTEGTDSADFSLSASSPYGFSGVIDLGCAGIEPARCAFDPAAISPGQSTGLAVRNLSALPTDSLRFVATGTSGTQTTSVPLIVVITDFALAASPAQATVAAGGSATYSLTVSPLNGFTQTVELSCAGEPSATACTLTPTFLTVSGAGPASAKLTLQTTARALAAPRVAPPYSSPRARKLWWLACLVALAFSTWLWGWRSGRGRWATFRALASLLAGVLLWAACGGGGGGTPPPPSYGTPPGTYTITITANLSLAAGGNSAPLSHRTTVILTVN